MQYTREKLEEIEDQALAPYGAQPGYEGTRAQGKRGRYEDWRGDTVRTLCRRSRSNGNIRKRLALKV